MNKRHPENLLSRTSRSYSMAFATTKQLLLYLVAAAKQLQVYEGEEIIAFEHPLHDAVRDLELLTLKRQEPNTFKQKARLYDPLCGLWFGLLGASRGATTLHPREWDGGSTRRVPGTGEQNPKQRALLAMQWASYLEVGLKAYAGALLTVPGCMSRFWQVADDEAYDVARSFRVGFEYAIYSFICARVQHSAGFAERCMSAGQGMKDNDEWLNKQLTSKEEIAKNLDPLGLQNSRYRYN